MSQIVLARNGLPDPCYHRLVQAVFKRHWAPLLALTASLLAPTPARAFVLYMEMGGGGGWLLNSTAFFGSDTSQMALSSNYNLGLMASFLDGHSPIDIHAGVIGKMTNGVIGNSMYTTLTPWAELRIQISRVYFGVGLTPFTFKRVGTDFGFNNLMAATAGQIGFIAEAGFLIPVTPNFTVSLEAASQYIANGFGFSPQPGLDLSANFRFYLWYPSSGGGTASGTMNFSGSTKSKGTSNEYKGWRYPF